MNALVCWSPVIFAVAAVTFLAWVRSGSGGKFGQAIRWSDWHAWRRAMDDKERELKELKSLEPKV